VLEICIFPNFKKKKKKPKVVEEVPPTPLSRHGRNKIPVTWEDKERGLSPLGPNLNHAPRKKQSATPIRKKQPTAKSPVTP
jgi:hypothetical protein